MKKAKLLWSIAIAFVCSMFMTLNVHATSNCASVSSLNDLKAAFENTSCDEVKITSSIEIPEGEELTLTNKRLVIGSSSRLAVAKGAKLIITGYDNSKSKGTTNVWLETGARLVVRGTVDASTSSTNGLIAFQSAGTTTGEINVLDGGELKVSGYVNGAIAILKDLNVSNKGRVTLTGNGYGTNGFVNIKLNNGHIVANNKNVGLNGVINASGNSTIEATGNGILGINFRDGSIVKGTTKITATGNGTNTDLANADKRLADITISGRLGINDSAEVTTGVIREFYEVGGNPSTATGFDNQKETKLVVQGPGAVVNYTKIIENGTENEGEKLSVYQQRGILRDAEGNVKAVKIEEYIVQPNEKLSLEKTEEVPGKIYALNGSAVENKTGKDVTVTVPGLASNTEVTIKAGETKNIKVITVNINNQNYFILAGESLSDISALAEFLADENISRLETSDGVIITEQTKLEKDTTVIVRNKVKVTYDGETYTLEYEETWNGQSEGAKALQRALSKAHHETTRDWVEYLGNGKHVDNTFKFTEDTEITVKYNVKVTVNGKTESYAENTKIDDMDLLAGILSNPKFSYFKGDDGKIYKAGDTVSHHVTLTAIYKVVVNFDGEDFVLELAEGEKATVGSAKNSDGKTLAEAMKEADENVSTTNKNSVYFVDAKGNDVYDNTLTSEDMIVTSKYTVRVTVGNKVVTPDEGTKVQDVKMLAEIAQEEGFLYFKDAKGNRYDLETVLDSNVTLTAVYKVVVNFDGEDFVLELAKGETATVGSAKNAEGKTLAEAMKEAKKNAPKTKNSVYFVDAEGNYVYDTTVTGEDMTVTSKYTVRVTVGSKVVTPDEGTKVQDVKMLAEIAQEEGFLYFKDAEGNRYDLETVLNSNVELTAVYKEKTVQPSVTVNPNVPENPETLDNVSSYIYMMVAAVVSMVAGAFVLLKNKLFN